MLLVIDFSLLKLDMSVTDIEINDNNDFTAESLLSFLCDGIEEIGTVRICDRRRLALCKSDGSVISADYKISELRLNDWDTLYIKRV